MKLFGTDGIRGPADTFPLDRGTVTAIGRGLARLLRREVADPLVILGGDTRESTPRIIASVAQGLGEGGARTLNAGVIPTPAIAALVLARGARAGISVSASHNPWPDNGIKIFGNDGRKFPDESEAEIERMITGTALPVTGVPPVLPVEVALAETFLNHLAAAVPVKLSGFRMRLDCANGAAFELAPRAFTAAGANVSVQAASPDGRNINLECGALHPEHLAAGVARHGEALGAAFDGDADRCILSDETGRVLDGDDIVWMLARDMKSRGLLNPPLVVGTVMSNFGLETALAGEGITLRRAPVGDRHVVRLMRETGAPLGGEASGHVVLGELSTTGDGILTALAVAALLERTGKPLSKLADLVRSPQILKSVRVARRIPLDDAVTLVRELARAEEELSGCGRVLVRYSGTEPLLRIMVEGSDALMVDRIAARLADAAMTELSDAHI